MPPTKPRSRQSPSRFAESDEEAERRYLAHKSVDPFPTIPASVLNSADFPDYVSRTGLIFPYWDDDDDKKPSSYRARVLKCVYTNEHGQRITFDLQDGQEFKLPAGSVVYVTVEPYFRLPNYIKIKYHLDVTQSFKGLLLNSGSIDPGYVGALCVPLHNPTPNEYTVRAHDSLIWMEFIKISPLDQWNKQVIEFPRQGEYREFPQRKLGHNSLDHNLDNSIGREGHVCYSRHEDIQTIRTSQEAVKASEEKVAALEREFEAKLAVFERTSEERVAALEREFDVKIAAFERAYEAKVAALEREFDVKVAVFERAHEANDARFWKAVVVVLLALLAIFVQIWSSKSGERTSLNASPNPPGSEQNVGRQDTNNEVNQVGGRTSQKPEPGPKNSPEGP